MALFGKKEKDTTPAGGIDADAKAEKEVMSERMVDRTSVKSEQGESTQQYLDVEEIRDGVIVLRDSSLRMIVMVSSMNFALKSSEEQEAIILAYQSFLNSVEFPIQIVVQSRLLDINSYLDSLRKRESEQTTELLRIQTAEYIDYISSLVELSHIMSKSFYISIPLFPFEKDKNGGMFSKLFQPAQQIIEKEKDFERYRDQLLQRVDHIATGLQGVGLKVAPLSTQALIELLYNTYNPATFQQENLADISKLDVSTGDFVPEDEASVE